MPQTMENSLPHFWKIKCPFYGKVLAVYICDGAYNYTDDDIIEMMLFSIHLDQWLEENFMEEAE